MPCVTKCVTKNRTVDNEALTDESDKACRLPFTNSLWACRHHGTPRGAVWSFSDLYSAAMPLRESRQQRSECLAAGEGVSCIDKAFTWILISLQNVMPEIHAAILNAGITKSEKSFCATGHSMDQSSVARVSCIRYQTSVPRTVNKIHAPRPHANRQGKGAGVVSFEGRTFGLKVFGRAISGR